MFPSKKFTPLAFALIAVFGVSFVNAQSVPDNVDGGLRRLISSGVGASAIKANAFPKGAGFASKRGVFDGEGRVLVTVHLNGAQPLSKVRDAAVALGGRVDAEKADYQSGLLSVYLPLSQVSSFATKPGVLSLRTALKPITHSSTTGVGDTISGGAYAIHSTIVNASGNKGAGVKVGVLSNSFDTATSLGGNTTSTSAAQDILSGDLPGPGNPDGYTTAISPIIDDLTADDGQTDEGRAMLQIVHDVAPAATLAFATANTSEAGFANNIIALKNAGCQVIVDDVLYFDEPMFSDGIVSQAVDTVAGAGVKYFSSAGNEQGAGYVATFNPVSDATARAGMLGQNLKLNQVPAKYTKGGFHNFSTTPGKVDISQTFTADPFGFPFFVFQWNDPYASMAHPVTTDYNILIFDKNGNWIDFIGANDGGSGIEKNTGGMGSGTPLEFAAYDNSANPGTTTYQIVLARADNSPATPKATQLRYWCFDFSYGGADGADEYYQPLAPATYGHSSSANAMSVAAYVYSAVALDPVRPPFFPQFENYTSQGPSSIYFQADGTKLAAAQVRNKPDIAAPDGGNTTFFGFDYEGDGWPNFFGTSAAAPHAAGLAALMLSKNSSLTQAQVRTFLQNSPLSPHDLDPFSCTATATTPGGGKVIVNGSGTDLNSSSHDPNFFHVTFVPGTTGETLKSVTIDVTNAGLSFDSSSATGFPFQLGSLKNITTSQITNNVPVDNGEFETLTLTFASGAFTGASSVNFGVDRDFVQAGGGNHGDYLSGGQISAVTTKGTGQGTFVNKLGTGFSILDGWGFIDAQKALKQVP